MRTICMRVDAIMSRCCWAGAVGAMPKAAVGVTTALNNFNRSFNDIAFLDSGEAVLPDEVLVSEEAHGISVIDGRIIATWMKDNSELDGETYILTPKIEDKEIQWSITGTCGSKKAC